MFLIDDLLMMPARGMMAIFREIQNAARQEVESEAEAVRARLCDLYQLLETKQITDEEFDARERILLDRLDAIEARQSPAAEEEEEEEEEDLEVGTSAASEIIHSELAARDIPQVPFNAK